MNIDRALLLDRNYMALSVVSWKKAIKLIVKGKAEEVESTGSIALGRFQMSSVIRLVCEIPWRAHKEITRFSRKNVLTRDNFTCCYCGDKVGKNGTIDHLVPKSRGGKSDYLNCVTSCRQCNSRKSDKTLEKSGMRLLYPPKVPMPVALSKSQISKMPEDWSYYIIRS